MGNWTLFIASYDAYGDMEYIQEGCFKTEAAALAALGNRVGYAVEV